MASESMPIRGPDCLPFDAVILRASPSWLGSLRPIRIPGRSHGRPSSSCAPPEPRTERRGRTSRPEAP
jgi:hypothetical protein